MDGKRSQVTPLISIITAAYNVEKYLPACLDSILAQFFSDFELILIDDGSADRTGQICDEYAVKDERVRVFHQSNRGVSDTWNRGIELAQGKFVGFVDSDDIIHPQMYELLYHAAVETDSDIAYCGYQTFANEPAAFSQYSDNTVRISSQEEEMSLLSRIDSGSVETIWRGLYRYECIKDLRFVSGRTWQDWMWTPCAVLNARKIVRVDRILYFWRQRPGSNSRSNSLKHYNDGLLVSRQLLDYLRENHSEWIPMYALRSFSSCLTLYDMLPNANSKDRHECEETIRQALEYFKYVSFHEIIYEPHTKPYRKLLAVIGKISFPLAAKTKKALLTIYNH